MCTPRTDNCVESDESVSICNNSEKSLYLETLKRYINTFPATSDKNACFKIAEKGAKQINCLAPLVATFMDKVGTTSKTFLPLNLIPKASLDSLRVVKIEPHESGFKAVFNKVIDPSTLSLYDIKSGFFGSADLTLTGKITGAVKGSAVLSPDQKAIIFAASNGRLKDDDYTIVIRGQDRGIRSVDGYALFAKSKLQPGENFIGYFSQKSSNSTFLKVPYFVRGPKQSVRVPAYSQLEGFPIHLISSEPITRFQFRLVFDSNMFSIARVILGSQAPVGSTVNFQESGNAIFVEFASPTPIPAGSYEILRVVSTVPSTATYNATTAIGLENVIINSNSDNLKIPYYAAAVISYFGDVDGSKSYSRNDVSVMQQVTTNKNVGYQNFINIDPLIVGDVSGNGTHNALDAGILLTEIVFVTEGSGVDVATIPPMP